MALRDIDSHIYWAPQKKIGGGWVVFKSSPDTPAAPDPYTTGNAQTQSNIKTAEANKTLNNTNQYTPWGSMVYTKTPAGAFDQAGYDAALNKYNANLAASQKDRNGTPFSEVAPSREAFTNGGGVDQWNSTITLSPAQQQLLDASNKQSIGLADLANNQMQNVAGSINKPLDFSGLPQYSGFVPGVSPVQDRIDTNHIGEFNTSVAPTDFRTSAAYGKIQDKLDTSGVPSMVGGDKLYDMMQQARDASFNQQKGYLDPQYAQQQHDLENKLTQQGIMQNSDAWNRAVDDFGRQRTQAYQNANDNSVQQGLNAQAQLYGQGLSSNQNAFNQAMGSGQFANSAQAQGFGQDMQNAGLYNDASNAKFAQGMANAALNNNVVNSKFNQAAQQHAQTNAAQQQTFGQMNQRESNNLAARQQGISELLTQQQNPLNTLNALRTGSQVQAPTFGAGAPTSNIGNTDLMGAFNNQFNAQMGGVNAKVAQNNANTQAGVGLASAGLMALMF